MQQEAIAIHPAILHQPPALWANGITNETVQAPTVSLADGEVRDVEIKVDHGGKITGVVLVGDFERRDAGESPLLANSVPELG